MLVHQYSRVIRHQTDSELEGRHRRSGDIALAFLPDQPIVSALRRRLQVVVVAWANGAAASSMANEIGFIVKKIGGDGFPPATQAGSRKADLAVEFAL
jgi:hypothetical protein